jgi:hypothetical protein
MNATKLSHKQKLMASLLPLGIANNWENAIDEWAYIDLYQKIDGVCPCGQKHIINRCVLENLITKETIEVGSDCVKNFLNINTHFVFDGMDKLRKDPTKKMNEDFFEFVKQRKWVNEWQIGFYHSICIRHISFAKMTKKQKTEWMRMASEIVKKFDNQKNEKNEK